MTVLIQLEGPTRSIETPIRPVSTCRSPRENSPWQRTHGSRVAAHRSFVLLPSYTEKLALARYAEEYGNEFLRMESVAKAGDDLRTLDLQDPTVREAVRDFEGGKVTALYESDAARDYV